MGLSKIDKVCGLSHASEPKRPDAYKQRVVVLILLLRNRRLQWGRSEATQAILCQWIWDFDGTQSSFLVSLRMVFPLNRLDENVSLHCSSIDWLVSFALSGCLLMLMLVLILLWRIFTLGVSVSCGDGTKAGLMQQQRQCS